MERLIVCPECAVKIADKDSPLYLAMFGPQGAGLEDPCILVTMPIEICLAQRDHPLVAILGDAMKWRVTCDGDCGRELGVSESSLWFMEQKQTLENLPVN